MLKRNFLSPEFGANVLREVLEVPEFPFNTVYGGGSSSIRSAVSIELRLVTDGRTDGHRAIASTRAARSRCRFGAHWFGSKEHGGPDPHREGTLLRTACTGPFQRSC